MKKPKSKYTGVHYNDLRGMCKHKPWEAYIGMNKEAIYLGRYATDREAAIAYDKRVIQEGLDRPLNILKPLNNENSNKKTIPK